MYEPKDGQLTVSVIIPAYNAQKTLERCIKSLLAQSCSEYEIVIIDDGSNDNTKSIANSYAINDCRIKVISQLNSGPSAARNNGLAHASGNIIAFVDSDDFVEPIFVEQLIMTFSKYSSDAVFFEFSRTDGEGNKISTHHLPELVGNYYDTLISLSKADMFGYTWIKAFRKSVLENIQFDESMNLFEDEVFTCTAMKMPLKLSFIRKNLYNYTCSDSSSLARRTHNDYYLLCDKVYCAWKELLDGYKDGRNILAEKAEHFQTVCKFYGLERKVDINVFFQGLQECEFMKCHPSDDLLIRAIQNKRWNIVAKEILVYKAKTQIRKLFWN